MGRICQEVNTSTSPAMMHKSTWKLSYFLTVYSVSCVFGTIFNASLLKLGLCGLYKPSKSSVWRRTPLCFGLRTGISTLYEFGTRIPKQQKWLWDMLHTLEKWIRSNWYPTISKCSVFPYHCCCGTVEETSQHCRIPWSLSRSVPMKLSIIHASDYLNSVYRVNA